MNIIVSGNAQQFGNSKINTQHIQCYLEKLPKKIEQVHNSAFELLKWIDHFQLQEQFIEVIKPLIALFHQTDNRGCSGLVLEFTTTYTISAYHH